MGVRERLRLETRAEHVDVERTLALTDPALDLATYRHRLARMLGFYAPVEAALARRPGLPAWIPDLAQRRKLDWLRADLHVLGVEDADDLPACTAMPDLATDAACFGCLYVLEGATLGGQVIGRHLVATLGVTPDRGGRFFDAYGRDTGRMWRGFLDALGEYAASTPADDAIVAAARDTFRTLQAWCAQEAVRP